MAHLTIQLRKARRGRELRIIYRYKKESCKVRRGREGLPRLWRLEWGREEREGKK